MTNYKLTLAYLIQIPDFSKFMFDFQLQKIQIIPTKYPKLVENDSGIFWGVTICIDFGGMKYPKHDFVDSFWMIEIVFRKLV